MNPLKQIRSSDETTVSRFPSAFTRTETDWIPWELATLCADCDTVHNQPDGVCPRCTSKYGILLSRLLAQKHAV
jgi:uncharacterized paraquat-inducible protein A